MKINPYLSFAGNCEEAFRTYERVFGGKIVFMLKNKDAPLMEAPPSDAPGNDASSCGPAGADMADKVMHACLMIGEQAIMGGDAPPQFQTKPQGICVSIMVDEPAEAERIYAALAEGGEVIMPMEETFWAPRFGMCTDRFGIPWMLNGGAKEVELPNAA